MKNLKFEWQFQSSNITCFSFSISIMGNFVEIMCHILKLFAWTGLKIFKLHYIKWTFFCNKNNNNNNNDSLKNKQKETSLVFIITNIHKAK